MSAAVQGATAGPAVPDPASLRRIYGAFGTGVAVVATYSADGAAVGMTVNSFTSVSLSPPLISFCPAKSCAAFPVYCTMTHFSVNILTRQQLPLSERFARSSGASKWEGVACRRGAHDVPLIEGSLAALECAVEHRVEAGDHVLVVGRVLGMLGPRDDEPLMFYCSRYGTFSALARADAGEFMLGWGL